MIVNMAKRVKETDFQSNFSNDILKAAKSPDIISFAGGLPSPVSFPVKEMEEATKKVLEENGVMALQYSDTQGYQPLRQSIADRYAKFNSLVSAEDIIITNGSQQALDLLAAVFIDRGDPILMEKPSYLAAYQSFHFYEPVIHEVELCEDGVNTEQLDEILEESKPKFFYAIPNFQNPTGLSYSKEKRLETARVMKKHNCFFVEDNPYGELIFKGEPNESMYTLLGEQCVMIGTYSKTLSPGMRIGWICCRNQELREKLLAEKQRVDLHTNIFCQMVIAQYLKDNDYDKHIEKIKQLYSHQADTMIQCMKRYFPEGIHFTEPEGGMFLWVTLPEGMTAISFGEKCAEKGVAICPGDAFYEYNRKVQTLRLNYTNCDDETIEKGIQILGEVLKEAFVLS